MKWIILIFGIACNASASVLVKYAMSQPQSNSPFLINTNWPIWLGLFLYGMTFILYAVALSKLPLTVVHPVLTTGSVAAVALCSAYIFHEAFRLSRIIGILFVIAGVILITMAEA